MNDIGVAPGKDSCYSRCIDSRQRDSAEESRGEWGELQQFFSSPCSVKNIFGIPKSSF